MRPTTGKFMSTLVSTKTKKSLTCWTISDCTGLLQSIPDISAPKVEPLENITGVIVNWPSCIDSLAPLSLTTGLGGHVVEYVIVKVRSVMIRILMTSDNELRNGRSCFVASSQLLVIYRLEAESPADPALRPRLSHPHLQYIRLLVSYEDKRS
jgi:hypothetical protein